ncbi:MAG: M48 family metalloprotease [Myxococcota bacterium]
MTRLALAALLLCGCASSGTARFAVRLSQNDIIARNEALQRVDRDIGLLGDEPLAGYMQSVGNGLGFPQVSFSVLNSEEPNAYALDSGAVFVSRGLLALLNDEGELASVLGHETGHIAANHGKKREIASAPFDALSKTLRKLLGLIKPSVGNRVADATNTTARVVALAPISRAQERRADEAGVELAAAAGYDPLSLTHVLRRLEAYVAAQSTSWLDDHPPVADRSRRMGERIAELRLPTAAAEHPTLLPMLDGLVMDDHPLDGAAVASKVIHPRFGVTYEVPAGWQTERDGPVLVSSGDGCTVLLEGSTAEGSPDEVVGRNGGDGSVEPVAVEESLRRLPGKVARSRAEAAGIHVELVVFGDETRSRILSGAWPVENAATCAPSFATTIASLREANTTDVASLPIVRLRIIVAHAGESLGSLLFRHPSAWQIERVAALNGVGADHVFEHDAAVKVPRREVWGQRGLSDTGRPP